MLDDKKYNIVIVDDNEDVRRLLRKVLMAAGHNIIEAVDGMNAIEILGQTVPDLVLMDIRMPGELNGLQTTEKIKHDERLQGVPVVALTASVLDKDRREAEAAGCDGFIGKPINVTELPQLIASFIEASDIAV